MATVKCQLAATTAKLPGITRRMRGEASAYRQSVAAYKAAETNAVDLLSYSWKPMSIGDRMRLAIMFFTKLLILGKKAMLALMWKMAPWWFKNLYPELNPNTGPRAIPGGGVFIPPHQLFPDLFPTPPKPVKPYPGAGFPGYSVAAGFDASYCYNQHNYSRFIRSDGKNVGCTATAEAIVVSIAKGKAVSPNEMGWRSEKSVKEGQKWGATWQHSQDVPGSKDVSQDVKLVLIAAELVRGNAVIVRSSGAHSVAAIGIRDGADYTRLTPRDILIVDPADGKVKTLDQAANGCNMPDDWALKVAK